MCDAPPWAWNPFGPGPPGPQMFLNAPTYVPHEPLRRLPWLRFFGIATILLLIFGAFLAVAVPHPLPASSTPQQEHRVYNYPSYTPEDWGRSFNRAERQNGDASPPLSPVGKRESLLSLAWGSTSNFRSGIGSYLAGSGAHTHLTGSTSSSRQFTTRRASLSLLRKSSPAI